MSPIRRVFPKKRGTILTDYGKKRERFESDIATINVKYGTDFDVEKETQKFSTINAPTLLADEKAIGRKKKKKVAAERRQQGRQSTILSETLG